MADINFFWLVVVILACGQILDIWFNAEPVQLDFWLKRRWRSAGSKLSNCPYCLTHYVALLCTLIWTSVALKLSSAAHVVLLTLAVSRGSWLLNQLLPAMLQYNRPKLIEEDDTDDRRTDVGEDDPTTNGNGGYV